MATDKWIVLGNGPSLRQHMDRGDFETVLPKFTTMAMNAIYLLFEPNKEEGIKGTAWRPNYWLWVETPKVPDGRFQAVEDEFIESMKKYHFNSDTHCMIAEGKKYYFTEEEWRTPNIEWILRCKDYAKDCGQGPYVENWHLPILCVHGSTMSSVLQYVYLAGAKDVAVIGCDLGIVEPDLEARKDFSHFHSQYYAMPDGSLERFYADQDSVLVGVHKTARDYFESDGRRIVNCGIGGKLDVYDRIDLQEWAQSDWPK